MLPLESMFGPILPEHPEELVVGIVLFLIVWWVIAKKVTPMFEATYAERTAAIQGGIAKAEAAQAEAAAALQEYTAQLAEARGEASRIREEAKTQGAAIIADMRQQAADESSRMLANAKAQIDAERAAAINALRTEVGGLATSRNQYGLGVPLIAVRESDPKATEKPADTGAGAKANAAAAKDTPADPPAMDDKKGDAE